MRLHSQQCLDGQCLRTQRPGQRMPRRSLWPRALAAQLAGTIVRWANSHALQVRVLTASYGGRCVPLPNSVWSHLPFFLSLFCFVLFMRALLITALGLDCAQSPKRPRPIAVTTGVSPFALVAIKTSWFHAGMRRVTLDAHRPARRSMHVLACSCVLDDNCI